MFRREDGAITVFFSIIVLVFIILTAVIVEGSRIRISELQGHRALEVAGRSVLAGYNSSLKNEYGLFALANTKEEDLKHTISYYFLNNTAIALEEEQQAWNLFDYRLEDVSIILKDSLDDASVVREQVLQLMKYRGIQAIGEVFLDKLLLLSSGAGTLQVLDKKLKLEKEMLILSELQQELKRQVVLGGLFDTNSQFDVVDQIYREVNRLIAIKSEIKNLEKDIANIREMLRETPMEEREPLNESLYRESLKLSDLQRSLTEGINHIENSFSLLSEGLRLYLNINNGIEGTIEEIYRQRDFLRQEFKDYQIDFQGKRGSLLSNVEEALEDEIKYYEEILNPEELEGIYSIAKENQIILRQGIQRLEGLRVRAVNCINTMNLQHMEELYGLIYQYKDVIRKYNLELKYSIPQVSQKELVSDDNKDTREDSAEKGRTSLRETVNGIDVLINEDILRQLPSQGMQFINYPKDDIEFEESKVGDGYTDRGLGEIGLLVAKLKNIGVELRDTLLVNEYIVGTFKSYTTACNKNEKSITGQYKNNRSSFFDYEVEYILYGNPSQLQNIFEVKRDLLLMRFVLNLLYIYTEPQLLSRATIIASSIALLLGAASMPIIKTMIIAGWAMGYSIEDMQQLLEGKEIPLLKNQDRIMTNYQDYLRFLLLGIRPTMEKKLNRVMDLIHLNFHKEISLDSDFVRSGFYSNLGITGEYTIKYLFMNMPFMQNEMDMSVTRYRFKKAIWMSY